MHLGEIATDAALVRRLLAAQFPAWAGLPVEPLATAGTDHALYRLGDDMVVRLPRRPEAALQVRKEQEWLPFLASFLPLEVPAPLGSGQPSADFRWAWTVVRWIEGEDAAVARVVDPRQAAEDLGRFVAALQLVDPSGGPPSGEHNSLRGAPLEVVDAEARRGIGLLEGDGRELTAAWEAALGAPVWRGRPVWHHGDLLPGNVLVRGGRYAAVIDWGCSGIGDPACDVMAAWTMCSAETRDLFRAAVRVDDATWARGRGWALWFGLVALPYYRTSNPVLARIARRAIDEVLADHRRHR
jgi:aminoglycoside phosphotransferase (APT) family kinase protein